MSELKEVERLSFIASELSGFIEKKVKPMKRK
jgi:hypothetical protein